jgi:hypothetical protein
MGHGQSSPVSCCLVSCFFQSAFAANEVCSVQKVQNQGPPFEGVALCFAVEEVTDRESTSVGRGEGIDRTSTGLNASEIGDADDKATLVGFRPER